MWLLLSKGLPKGTRGFHRARRGSAANHEIICRKHRRLGIRISGTRYPFSCPLRVRLRSHSFLFRSSGRE
jgi:hypothetical protein